MRRKVKETPVVEVRKSFLFESREELVLWLSQNLRLDLDQIQGCGGDTGVYAKVFLDNDELLTDSTYVSVSQRWD